jgi:hypothetical protein
MSSPCAPADNFPAVIDNRPGLPRIAYRIGRYSDFRAKMLSSLDQTPLLSGWTHRGADDPGIALLESAAIVSDILTFYQELYANERWLRTATWDSSVQNLVRLTGYRLAPGLGGQGLVAFEVAGTAPVTVPSGFPLSAQIVGGAAPANFETSTSLVAVPALSRFGLYAPTSLAPITTGTSQFGLAAADLAAAGVTIKVGDRLMLVDTAQSSNRQISVVTAVTTVLDQTVVTIAGGWQGAAPGLSTFAAYKLGRTFRAFGYNAPSTQFSVNSSNQPVSKSVSTTLALPATLNSFPLDHQVDDLSAGACMLVDLQISNIFGETGDFFLATQAYRVWSDTDSVGPMNGGVTRVELQSSHPSTGVYVWTDRRTAICHEVIGQKFPVSGVRLPALDPTVDSLAFFGDSRDYQALDGALLQFVDLNADDTAARVQESIVAIDRAALPTPPGVGVFPLTLASALTQFSYADFPLTAPTIVVLGNVVAMTQGRTQPPVVLGNGDARQTFQSFQLPKSPLTWLEDESMTPPRSPQAQILVNQIAWSYVDSLYGSGPKDNVYILREDSSGNWWVQFGDGVTGARLSSGIGNVSAIYRTGDAANGWRQSGAKAQSSGSLPALRRVDLYDEVTGGTQDEVAAHMRVSAPASVEELGRIVTLADFEAEALALSGVEKAAAIWDPHNNVPIVKLNVLLADDTPAQLGALQAAITQANVARGPNRYAVKVIESRPTYVFLTLAIGLAPGYQQGPVLAAVNAAVGVLPADGGTAPEGGLFSLDARALGQEEYASRIEGAVQNVAGVAWVEVTGFGALGDADDPSTLAMPVSLSLAPTIACAPNRVLALYAAQFNVSAGAP